MSTGLASLLLFVVPAKCSQRLAGWWLAFLRSLLNARSIEQCGIRRLDGVPRHVASVISASRRPRTRAPVKRYERLTDCVPFSRLERRESREVFQAHVGEGLACFGVACAGRFVDEHHGESGRMRRFDGMQRIFEHECGFARSAEVRKC